MCRAGHDDEFEQFAVGAWPRLVHAAYLLAHDRHGAEDLAQTTMTKVDASWSRVRRDDAYSFARRVLANTFIDTRRRLATARKSPPARDVALDPVGVVDDRHEVMALLSALSERERAVVVLRYYLDTSVEETAAALGISAGTVKSTASRALAAIRVREGALDEGHHSAKENAS